MELLHESLENPGDRFTAPHTIRLSRTPKAYATHWHNTQDGGSYFGHYFESFEDAALDFFKRCKDANVEPQKGNW